MKTIYLLIIATFAIQITQAQIVNIPDANFKNALVNTACIDTDNDSIPDTDADSNNDGEIQLVEAEAIINLNLYNQNISSLVGIEAFINLQDLKAEYNAISNLDLSNQPNLIVLDLANNQIASVDLSNQTNLVDLKISSNPLTSIDISNSTTICMCRHSNNTA